MACGKGMFGIDVTRVPDRDIQGEYAAYGVPEPVVQDDVSHSAGRHRSGKNPPGLSGHGSSKEDFPAARDNYVHGMPSRSVQDDYGGGFDIGKGSLQDDGFEK